MTHFNSSLILEDKSFKKLGPRLSPDTHKYALQQNAMHCFKLISPLFLRRKVQHLKLKHTWVGRLPVLGRCQQPQHTAFISASKCGRGGWEWGRKGGPVEGKKRNKQTEKENGVGWTEGEMSCISNIVSPWLGNAVRSLPRSPGCIFFVTVTSHAGKILVIPHIFYPQKRLPCPVLGD